MHPDYEAKPIELSENHIERYAALLRATFPDAAHLTEAYLQWLYVDNPSGPAFGFDAYNGREIAAHFVLQPLEAKIGSDIYRGALSLNAATHPNHRRKGLYFDLGRLAHETAIERGYDFTICVTNQHSTSGFIKQLGLTKLGPLDVKVGIGSLPKSPPVDDFAGFRKHWTREGLLWRQRCPTVPYSTREYRDGVHVLGSAKKLGASVFMGKLPAEDFPTQERHRVGPNPLKLWIGIDPKMKWSGSLYFDLPMRFRPSPLNLLFKSFKPSMLTPDVKSLRWTGLDFDTF